jgi:GTPase SAR1 family protein
MGYSRSRTISSTNYEVKFKIPSHYRKALGAIIVFDVASRNSFFHVNTWLEATRERADHNVQIMLVGHKVDQNRREISRQEAE